METIVSTFLWKRTRVPIFKKFVCFFVKILYVPQWHCYVFREVLLWCRPWRLSRCGCTNGHPFMNKSQAHMGVLSWSIFYVAVRIGMAVTNEFAGYECHTPQLCNRPVDQMAYMLWRCRRWWSIPNGAIPWIRLKDRNLRCIIGMRRCMNMREKGMSDSVTEQFQLTPTKSS